MFSYITVQRPNKSFTRREGDSPKIFGIMAPSSMLLLSTACCLAVPVTVLVWRSRRASAKGFKQVQEAQNRHPTKGKHFEDDEANHPLFSAEERKQLLKDGFSKKKIPEKVDVVLIGSGVGSLATASLLAQQGNVVLVLEQHDVAGGNTHTFEEDGYEFDTGLHYVGGRVGHEGKGIARLFEAVTAGGKKPRWAEMDEDFDVAVCLRKKGLAVEHDENPADGAPTAEISAKNDIDTSSEYIQERISMNRSLRVTKARLKEMFPDEETAIDRYFQLLFDAQSSMATWAVDKILPAFLSSILHFFSPREEKTTSLLLRSTADVVSSLTRNKRLRGILTYIYGDYLLPPSESSFAMHAAVVKHYSGGAFYPVGGPAELACCMVSAIQNAGGRVLVRAPVKQIIIDDEGIARGVEVKGNQIMARIVVSGAGALNTYTKLLPQDSRDLVRREIEAMEEKQLILSTSFISLFVGMKDNSDYDSGDEPHAASAAEGSLHGSEDPANMLKLPRQNFWVFPDWNHDENTRAFRQDKDLPFPAAFIAFPSAKDPTYQKRHPGKHTATMIAPVEYSWFAKYKDLRVKHRGEEYEALKEEFTQRLLEIFYQVVPQARGRVEYIDLGTPVTNDFYLGTSRGEVYGLAHSPARFEQSWMRPRTPIPNLYLTGQDVLSAGIAGALTGGFFTAFEISKKCLARNIFSVI